MKAEPDLKMVLAELRELRKELRVPVKRLLTVDETAHYLGLAPKSIRNGLGPKAVKPFPIKSVKVAGRVLFRREDLESFCDGLGAAE